MKRERNTTKASLTPLMLSAVLVMGLALTAPATFGATSCTAVLETTGTPTAVCPGSTNAYRITITNTTSPGSDAVKSINVAIPDGFVITGAITITPPSGKNWTLVPATGQIKLKANKASDDKLAPAEAIQVSFSATAPNWTDWAVGVDPSTDTVAPGGSTSATVSVSATAPAGAPTYTWNTQVWTGMDWTGTSFAVAVQPAVTVDATAELSASGQPAGVTVGFDPLSDEPDFTSTMNIAVDATVAPGTYPIDIVASCAACGAELGSTTFILIVAAPDPYEGLSHGYWKNHYEDWPLTGYSPAQTVGSVFSEAAGLGLGDYTLDEALDFSGGSPLTEKAEILLRQAVAALLNAAHPNINYPLTVAEVIAEVNEALAGTAADMEALKNLLDEYNNLEGDINS